MTTRNETNIPSITERTNLLQNLINNKRNTPRTVRPAVVDEFSQGNTNNTQFRRIEEQQQTDNVEASSVISIIDQELGDLIRSQRVSSLLNSETFRRTLEERLQNSLVNVNTTFPVSNPGTQNTSQEPELRNAVNVEQLMDPNSDPEIQALVNYQIVSNMLQSAFRTHLENTLWSRHIRRGNSAEFNEPINRDTALNSFSSTANQNNLLHSMRNELAEMRSMMKILLQSQIETHRSIRQEVTYALRSADRENEVNHTNDLSSSCVICLDSMADTIVYRCGHLCLCYACSIQIRINVAGGVLNCPVCRTPIQDIVRIYGSAHSLTN